MPKSANFLLAGEDFKRSGGENDSAQLAMVFQPFKRLKISKMLSNKIDQERRKKMKKQKTATYQSDLQLDGTKFKIQSLAFIFLILMSQLRNLLDFSRTIVTQTKHKRETLDARQHQFKKKINKSL